MKKLVILAMVAVFLPLLMCNHAISQEEVALEECYNGQEVTELAYYDTEMAAYVQVPVRCLPWWWEPAFLPYGWALWTPAIFPVAFALEGAFFSNGFVNFTSTEVIVRDARFARFRDHVRGMRGNFRRNFGREFERGSREAHKKFGNNLRKPPSGFKHTEHGAKGHPEVGKTQSRQDAKHEQTRQKQLSPKGQIGDVRAPKPNVPGQKTGVPTTTPNAVRGPRSPSTPQGSGTHQPGPGNVRSPRGPAGSPAIQPNVGGPRQPQGQVRRPQAGPVNRAPQVQRGPAAAAPRGPAARPAPAAKAAPPAKKQ